MIVDRRPAMPEDVAFVVALLETTMRDHVLATWGHWDAPAIAEKACALCASSATQILEQDGQPIGLLAVERHPTHLQIEQLYLLPAFQRQGIGEALVRCVIHEASQRGLPVRLRVLAVNPARHFYERLGFVVVQSTRERLFLERAPGAPMLSGGRT